MNSNVNDHSAFSFQGEDPELGDLDADDQQDVANAEDHAEDSQEEAQDSDSDDENWNSNTPVASVLILILVMVRLMAGAEGRIISVGVHLEGRVCSPPVQEHLKNKSNLSSLSGHP